MKNFRISIFFFCFILVSCDDLFLRFNYENYNCSKNNLDIKKISIIEDKVGSEINVLIHGISYNLVIIEIDEEKIVLKNYRPKILISIKRDSGKISGIYKKNAFSFKCEIDIFRI